jgi:TPR repeat protein
MTKVNLIGNQLKVAAGLYKAKRFSEALQIYNTLSIGGDIYATVQLARMYDDGLGTKSDKKLARELYSRAASRDSLYAKYYLGKFLVKEKDESDALAMMAELTEKGYLPAIYSLGLMLTEGVGGHKDPQQGHYYLKYASDKGHMWARRYLIGEDLRRGGIVTKTTAALRLVGVLLCSGAIYIRNADDNRIRT